MPAFPPECVVNDHTSIIDAFIEDQQRLSAVDAFSRIHDDRGFEPETNRFRQLLPATALASGEQYAFEVHLDKCSGCKACVTACHSLNGLDEAETWRDVGLLVSPAKSRWAPPAPAVAQHITSACHHCVDPACLNGCPVLAYDKDPVTGIVRHLDDQCIGCQYCVLKCPYDVPKYNVRLGIVRKCDLCSPRLAVGEAPACAQACPGEAIRITKVASESVRIEFRENGREFLPGAPSGDYTLPTTRYVRGNAAIPEHGLVAADASSLQPQPAHWPLVVMLVLSQAAMGAAGFAAALTTRGPLLWMALILLSASMAASYFHLGRPLGAWRFFLGLRRSWLSREILAFGVFITALTAALAHPLGLWPATVCGALAVFCSAMIYHDTRRDLWRLTRSLPMFVGTAILLGGSAAALFFPKVSAFAWITCAVAVGKLALELNVIRASVHTKPTSLRKTARIISQRFQSLAFARLAFCLIGGIGIPVLLMTGMLDEFVVAAASVAFLALLAGELIERMLFFRAVDAPKMPGGFTA